MTAPYYAHHYIGEYATDVACLAEIVTRGWDLAGSAREGMWYYNTTTKTFRWWNGSQWGAMGLQGRVITVTQTGGGGDTNSVATAITLASALTPTPSNPVIIRVSAGTYVENNSAGPITVPDDVHIVGIGAIGSVIITGAATTNFLFQFGVNGRCTLNRLSIAGLNGVGGGAILVNSGQYAFVNDLMIDSCTTGIRVTGAGVRFQPSLVVYRDCDVSIEVAAGAYICGSQARITCVSVGTTAVYCYGTGSYIEMHLMHIEGGHVNGLYANDGGRINVYDCHVTDAVVAVRVGNVGSPSVNAIGIDIFNSVSWDVWVETVTGVFSGSGSWQQTKVHNPNNGTINSQFVDVSTSTSVTTAPSWIQGSCDIGFPGTRSGMDVGEGGSYATTPGGVTVVQVWQYDASQPSGSRFTQWPFRAGTMLTALNDAVYIGSRYKWWAFKSYVSVAKSALNLAMEYWDGSAWRSMTIGMTTSVSGVPRANRIWENVETQYTSIEDGIDSGVNPWTPDNNVLDEIPDNGMGENWYWIRLRNTAPIATPATLTNIKCRGDDLDIKAGSGEFVAWGTMRPRTSTVLQEGIDFVPTGANLPGSRDFYISANVFVEGLNNSFQDGALDILKFQSRVPSYADTSGRMRIVLEWALYGSAAVGTTVEWVVRLAAFDGSLPIAWVAPGPYPETTQSRIVSVSGNPSGTIITTAFPFDVSALLPLTSFAVLFQRDARVGNPNDTFAGDVVLLNVYIEFLRWKL